MSTGPSVSNDHPFPKRLIHDPSYGKEKDLPHPAARAQRKSPPVLSDTVISYTVTQSLFTHDYVLARESVREKKPLEQAELKSVCSSLFPSQLSVS